MSQLLEPEWLELITRSYLKSPSNCRRVQNCGPDYVPEGMDRDSRTRHYHASLLSLYYLYVHVLAISSQPSSAQIRDGQSGYVLGIGLASPGETPVTCYRTPMGYRASAAWSMVVKPISRCHVCKLENASAIRRSIRAAR